MRRQPEWFQGGMKEGPDRIEGNGRRSTEDRRQAEYQRWLARHYVTYRPWDIRFHDWIESWVISRGDRDPKNFRRMRWRRFKFWLTGLYPKARSLFVAFKGPRLNQLAAAPRLEACLACPNLRRRLPKHKPRRGIEIKLYCGMCGCRDWKFSELRTKVRFALAECPDLRWPMEAGWEVDYIREMERRRRDMLEAEVRARTESDKKPELQEVADA